MSAFACGECFDVKNPVVERTYRGENALSGREKVIFQVPWHHITIAWRSIAA